jgi:hypothetical protein
MPRRCCKARLVAAQSDNHHHFTELKQVLNRANTFRFTHAMSYSNIITLLAGTVSTHVSSKCAGKPVI